MKNIIFLIVIIMSSSVALAQNCASCCQSWCANQAPGCYTACCNQGSCSYDAKKRLMLKLKKKHEHEKQRHSQKKNKTE